MNNYKIGTVISLAIAFVAYPTGVLYAKKPRHSAPQPAGNTTASNPNDPGGHSALGFAAAKARDYEKAIAEFSKAIEAEPGDSKNYFNRGTAYRGANKLTEALADFSKAIELAPQDAAAYIGRGEVLLVQKQLDPALADFDKALQIAPNDPNARRFRGFVFISKGEWQKAIEDYRSSDPKSSGRRRRVRAARVRLSELEKIQGSDRGLYEGDRDRSEGSRRISAPGGGPHDGRRHQERRG